MNTAQAHDGTNYTGWIEGAFTWPRTVARWEVKHDPRPETERDVLDAMSGGEMMTVNEIVIRAELPRGTVEGALKRLKGRRQVDLVRVKRPQMWRRA